MGVYWPTMRKDVFALVNTCGCQKQGKKSCGNVLTLNYMNAIAPKWAESIVEFLSTKMFPKNMSKLQQTISTETSTRFLSSRGPTLPPGKGRELESVCPGK